MRACSARALWGCYVMRACSARAPSVVANLYPPKSQKKVHWIIGSLPDSIRLRALYLMHKQCLMADANAKETVNKSKETKDCKTNVPIRLPSKLSFRLQSALLVNLILMNALRFAMQCSVIPIVTFAIICLFLGISNTCPRKHNMKIMIADPTLFGVLCISWLFVACACPLPAMVCTWQSGKQGWITQLQIMRNLPKKPVALLYMMMPWGNHTEHHSSPCNEVQYCKIQRWKCSRSTHSSRRFTCQGFLWIQNHVCIITHNTCIAR